MNCDGDEALISGLHWCQSKSRIWIVFWVSGLTLVPDMFHWCQTKINNRARLVAPLPDINRGGFTTVTDVTHWCQTWIEMKLYGVYNRARHVSMVPDKKSKVFLNIGVRHKYKCATWLSDLHWCQTCRTCASHELRRSFNQRFTLVSDIKSKVLLTTVPHSLVPVMNWDEALWSLQSCQTCFNGARHKLRWIFNQRFTLVSDINSNAQYG